MTASEHPFDGLGTEERPDLYRGAVALGSDICTGWQFCATMQLRTPLAVLLRHREVFKPYGAIPPLIATERWQGIWLPKVATLRELGVNVPDRAEGTMASDVGQIPTSGGEYLRFLLKVREIFEGDKSEEERRHHVLEELQRPIWKEFVQKLKGSEFIISYLWPIERS